MNANKREWLLRKTVLLAQHTARRPAKFFHSLLISVSIRVIRG
jgi:hypothetical protein